LRQQVLKIIKYSFSIFNFLKIYECHDDIRVLSQQAGQVVKQEGGDNDILQPKASDPFFQPQIHLKIHLINPDSLKPN